MTKSLTEQWREGTLEEKFYYILFASRFGEDYVAIDMFISDEKDFMYSSCEDVKEVLAPVPSYEEFIQQRDFVKDHLKVLIENMNLKRKLEIATKAFEELEIKSDKLYRGGNDWSLVEQLDFIKAKCQETLYHLEEMEGVK